MKRKFKTIFSSSPVIGFTIPALTGVFLGLSLWWLAVLTTLGEAMPDRNDFVQIRNLFAEIVWQDEALPMDLTPPASEAVEHFWTNKVRAMNGETQSRVELDGIFSATESVPYDLVSGEITAGPLAGRKMKGAYPWVIIYSGEHWKKDAKVLAKTWKPLKWVLLAELNDGGAFYRVEPHHNHQSIYRFRSPEGKHALVSFGMKIPQPLTMPFPSHSDSKLFETMIKSYGSYAWHNNVSLLKINHKSAQTLNKFLELLLSTEGKKVTAHDPVHGERIRTLRSMYLDPVRFPDEQFEGTSYNIVNIPGYPGLSFVRIYWRTVPERREYYVTESFIVIISKKHYQQNIDSLVSRGVRNTIGASSTVELQNFDGAGGTAYGTKLNSKDYLKKEVLTIKLDEIHYATFFPNEISSDDLIDLLANPVKTGESDAN